MQITVIVALALLVLTAIGFLVGRQRAMTSAQGRPAALHSLASYYGYFIALWTGVPSLLILTIHGLFGTALVNTLAMGELEREAAPLIRAYETSVAESGLLANSTDELEQLDAEVLSLRNELNRSRQAGLASDRYERELAILTVNRNGLIDSIEQERAALAQQVAERAPSSEAGLRARAGFEYWRATPDRKQRFVADARAIAFQSGFAVRRNAVLEAAGNAMRPWDSLFRWSFATAALAIAVGGLAWARGRITPGFRARNRVEGAIATVLFATSVIAILTTLGIVLSLLFETLRFFAAIDWRIHEFLFGLQWSPQVGIRADQIGQTGAFGAVPLFAGTALVTAIAMLVAVPVGLFSAIYLSEYAGPKFRSVAKPILEILAGVPTVVYGFFALLTVGPFIRDFAVLLGYDSAEVKSALSAGLVMGVMIIPFVSSLADDVINAVPQSLRDGAYAMGATKSEAVRQVVLPAALPGIVGAILLAVSRAIGETMIVVLAAGQGANLTINPLESVTTITVQIVALITGDLVFTGAKTLSAFALALVLFALTLTLNIVALRVVNRFRERYE